MTDAYGNESIFDYNPETGVHRVKIVLNSPDLEKNLEMKTNLENILSATFERIEDPDKPVTVTQEITNYSLKKEPVNEELVSKKTFFEYIGYEAEKLFKPKNQENKTICTTLYIHDRLQGTPRMDIEINLPVKGAYANRNREIIQNLNYEIRKLNAKLEPTYQT